MERDPDDVTVYGPVQNDNLEYLTEGTHWAGCFLRMPGIPVTSNPKKVTCASCRRAVPSG